MRRVELDLILAGVAPLDNGNADLVTMALRDWIAIQSPFVWKRKSRLRHRARIA